MPWEGSDRRDRLPRWWPVTVRRIIERDPVCRCAGCIKCWPAPNGKCLRPSREADHIAPGDDHRDENLRGVCRPCHARKSSMEGNAAKAEKLRYGKPAPPHPGKLY